MALLIVASSVYAADPPAADIATAYAACTEAASLITGASNEADDEVRAKCEPPARLGVPGAQYALGGLLVNRGSAGDIAKGVEWLEKAVAAGNSPAAFHLATVVFLDREDEESQRRARELLIFAACAGHPPALELFDKAGANREKLDCPARPDTDFSGDWILNLSYVETSEPRRESHRVTIAGGRARVYVKVKVDDQWTEAKPGKFAIAQEGETLTVSATDSSWDFDGRWIESWTIQFMRTGSNTSDVAFLRTVNNPDVPARFDWRTFAHFAEGTARRLEGP